jgi:hypothetical protein
VSSAGGRAEKDQLKLAPRRAADPTSPVSPPLLATLDLAGTVVTADALHAQREHAEFLVSQKEAHYILTVNNNQPRLYAQLASLPWRQVRACLDARERGHGRAEWRTFKLATVAAGIAFPHAAQAIQVIRRRRPLNGKKKWSTQTSYAVTSLAAHQAAPAQIAGWLRGHWGIEALHHIRSPGTGLAVASCGADATRMLFSC